MKNNTQPELVYTPYKPSQNSRDTCMEGQQACLHSIQTFAEFKRHMYGGSASLFTPIQTEGLQSLRVINRRSDVLCPVRLSPKLKINPKGRAKRREFHKVVRLSVQLRTLQLFNKVIKLNVKTQKILLLFPARFQFVKNPYTMFRYHTVISPRGTGH